MGRIRDLLLGPRAFEPEDIRSAEFAEREARDFTRQPTTGFQLDGSFSGIQAEDSLLELIAGFSGDWVNRSHALAVPAVLRSRNLIATTSATLTLELRNAKRELDERQWLGVAPSEDMSQTVMYALTFEDLLFHGRSYWRPTRYLGGFPVNAERIDYRSVSEQPMAMDPSRVINEDHLFEPDAPIYVNGVFEPNVIRFLSPNPPLLKYAARAIRTYLALDEAARRIAANPVPLGYFTDDDESAPLTDDEVQSTLDRWEENRRRRVWGYVESGLKLNQLQAVTPEQMQLTESRNTAALDIARAAGLDPDYLGIPSNSRTYANTESRRMDLVDFTLVGYLAAVEDRLSMLDVTPPGLKARFAVDEFSRADFATRMTAYTSARGSGVYELNELRRRENLPDIAEEQGNGAVDVRDAVIPGGPEQAEAERNGGPLGNGGGQRRL